MGFGIPRSDSEAKILVNRAQGVPKNSLSVYLVLVPILARITYPHWYLLVAADPTPARLRFSCRHVRGVASVVIITLKIIEKYYASRLKSMTHAWTTFCVTTIIHGFQFSNLHKYDLSCTCFFSSFWYSTDLPPAGVVKWSRNSWSWSHSKHGKNTWRKYISLVQGTDRMIWLKT